MLLLTSVTDKIRLVTGSAGTIDVHASWVDLGAASAITPGRQNLAGISTATTTDIVPVPAASTYRNVKTINVRNRNASANLITVLHTDGTNVAELFQVNLLPGEELLYTEGIGWDVYAANGSLKNQPAYVAAVQADMEAATSLVNTVTPGAQKWHPAHPKAWIKSVVTGGVPANTVSYGVTSVTDTGVGQLTVTWSTAFSSANYACIVNVERAATALTVANLRFAAVRFGGQAAGSVLAECWDGTATTALAADPAAWHLVALGDL